MHAERVDKSLRIITGSLIFMLLIASIATAQERPPSGQLNTEHSRVYIFVDKTGVVGHQHAIEGKLASGSLHLGGASGGGLVFNMKSFEADKPPGTLKWQFSLVFTVRGLPCFIVCTSLEWDTKQA